MAEQNKNNNYIPAGEIATFCGQISLILKAGIPLYDGMDTLCESCEDTNARGLFEVISKGVKDTGSLYKAVKKVGVFPDYMVNMVHIGEESGKLDDVLKSLTIYYEREAKIKKSIKSAVTYPILLILMMAAIIAVLVTRVMPIFENVFDNLGTEMSSSGKAIMNAGLNIGIGAFIFVGIIIVIMLVCYIIYKCGGQNFLFKVATKLPLLKGLNDKLASGRFASVISMMLSSGYDIEKALEMAPGIVTDKLAKEKIEKCGELLKSGSSFPEALMQINMFTGLQNRMINVGFKAGQLDSVMQHMSDIYDEEVDDAIEKLLAYIEPAIVAVLSLIIGGILLSVMLPLASIMSSIG